MEHYIPWKCSLEHDPRAQIVGLTGRTPIKRMSSNDAFLVRHLSEGCPRNWFHVTARDIYWAGGPPIWILTPSTVKYSARYFHTLLNIKCCQNKIFYISRNFVPIWRKKCYSKDSSSLVACEQFSGPNHWMKADDKNNDMRNHMLTVHCLNQILQSVMCY